MIKLKDIPFIQTCHCTFCMDKKSEKKCEKKSEFYTLFKNNTNKTLVYYDYGYGLWNSKISICYESNRLISNSNHFIDLEKTDTKLYQEIGNETAKGHKIYSRIKNNYIHLVNYKNNVNLSKKIINEDCIFLHNSFSGGNAGHDLYYTLDIIDKYIDTNIKFVLYNEGKNTNVFKIINLLIPQNRLIFINEKEVYQFENEIFDYEHCYYDSSQFSNIINKINLIIKEKIEKYKIPYELHNKNVLVLKNNLKNKHIVRSNDTFIIDEEFVNYVLTKNWYILDVESSDNFYINCYLLNNAKNIISCQRGISAFNQIFYNKNANFYALIVAYDNVIRLEKPHQISVDYMRNPDYICNKLYFDSIDTLIQLPITLNNNIFDNVIDKICDINIDPNRNNIYIYNLVELDIICSTFCKSPPEMEIFDRFLIQIKNNYNIVDNIEDADLAFIPIDYTKLIYLSPHHDYSIVPKGCPFRPHGTGEIYKRTHIKYFWDNYVKKVLNEKFIDTLPHFIFYPYVLFDIDFSYIPNNITIFSYENVISMYKVNKPLKSKNKLQTVPYILNENKHFKQSKIERYSYNSSKKYDIGFFGSIDGHHTNEDEHKGPIPDRPVVVYYRQFMNHLKLHDKISIIIDEGTNAIEYLPDLKYLLVLRGDTVTRLAFYQCFAYGIVPIIFEEEKKVYGNLLCPGINILNSCLILPNIDDKTPQDYAIVAKEIIEKELNDENNYLNKIKNHKEIFNNFNWFKEKLSKPVENIINYMVPNNKHKTYIIEKADYIIIFANDISIECFNSIQIDKTKNYILIFDIIREEFLSYILNYNRNTIILYTDFSVNNIIKLDNIRLTYHGKDTEEIFYIENNIFEYGSIIDKKNCISILQNERNININNLVFWKAESRIFSFNNKNMDFTNSTDFTSYVFKKDYYMHIKSLFNIYKFNHIYESIHFLINNYL